MPVKGSGHLSSKKVFEGRGLFGKIKRVASSVLNKTIDALPVELHFPGKYQFCGPGTKLEERLARGDIGINDLDKACKIHDIAYSQYKDNTRRSEADRVLANSAWERVKSKDASLGEKVAAWTVTTAMNVKSKLGSGMKKQLKEKKKRSVKGKGINTRKKKTTKKGGMLPIAIPALLAGISAIGSVVGSATGVAKTVSDIKTAQKQLAEQERHNRAMEARGKGLYLKPYKGSGERRKKEKNSRKKNFILTKNYSNTTSHEH